MLTFIREYSTQIHKDTLHSAMSVVARLCGKMEPTDAALESCMDSLSKLLHHEDSYVSYSSGRMIRAVPWYCERSLLSLLLLCIGGH